MLKNKRILLGVTGSIAAYKAALLTRLLVKEGAEVKVLMSPEASAFITPLTLSTLSKNPVYSAYSDSETGQWNNHVELAQWADIMLIAPATANTLAKMANGLCDNLLMATYLSAKCKVAFAPAMDLDMYRHPAVKHNLNRLTAYGHLMIPAESGELASGLFGEGRMAEPEHIVTGLTGFFKSGAEFAGKKALVTAGPTYEKIDPVRYIGNHSSGKMGMAIANALSEQGAKVTLILGPGCNEPLAPGIRVIPVVSANDMFEACKKEHSAADVIIMSAAVADYTPLSVSDIKIKKSAGDMNIALAKTEDILKYLGEHKKKQQILVGFALETNKEMEHAMEKLDKKNLDFIVLNSLNDKGAGFKTDTNKVTLIDRQHRVHAFELKSKKEVALDILKKVKEISDAK